MNLRKCVICTTGFLPRAPKHKTPQITCGDFDCKQELKRQRTRRKIGTSEEIIELNKRRREWRAQLMHKLKSQGMTLEEIAERFKCSHQNVSEILKNYKPT